VVIVFEVHDSVLRVNSKSRRKLERLVQPIASARTGERRDRHAGMSSQTCGNDGLDDNSLVVCSPRGVTASPGEDTFSCISLNICAWLSE
jgi:hypothetical protein